MDRITKGLLMVAALAGIGSVAMVVDLWLSLGGRDAAFGYYRSGTGASAFVQATGYVAGGLALATLAYVLAFGRRPGHRAVVWAMTGLWAIGPPVWLWYEYFGLYRLYGTADGLEYFRHGQATAAAIWAGLVATLYGLASRLPVPPVTLPADATRINGELEDAVLALVAASGPTGLPQAALVTRTGLGHSLVAALVGQLLGAGRLQRLATGNLAV